MGRGKGVEGEGKGRGVAGEGACLKNAALSRDEGESGGPLRGESRRQVPQNIYIQMCLLYRGAKTHGGETVRWPVVGAAGGFGRTVPPAQRARRRTPTYPERTLFNKFGVSSKPG